MRSGSSVPAVSAPKVGCRLRDCGMGSGRPSPSALGGGSHTKGMDTTLTVRQPSRPYRSSWSHSGDRLQGGGGGSGVVGAGCRRRRRRRGGSSSVRGRGALCCTGARRGLRSGELSEQVAGRCRAPAHFSGVRTTTTGLFCSTAAAAAEGWMGTNEVWVLPSRSCCRSTLTDTMTLLARPKESLRGTPGPRRGGARVSGGGRRRRRQRRRGGSGGALRRLAVAWKALPHTAKPIYQRGLVIAPTSKAPGASPSGPCTRLAAPALAPRLPDQPGLRKQPAQGEQRVVRQRRARAGGRELSSQGILQTRGSALQARHGCDVRRGGLREARSPTGHTLSVLPCCDSL